jgi:hypothetical protein
MLLPDLTNLARDLRQQMTDAERFLWSRLRRRFLGAKFRRQVPLGPFIVDFAISMGCWRESLWKWGRRMKTSEAPSPTLPASREREPPPRVMRRVEGDASAEIPQP